ncbi:MAG TPA: redoxin domain-containing protein [Nitrososphaerales archaeon]|nr:redoxin domain-containing protein [Nitrososphaerales archaeon]
MTHRKSLRRKNHGARNALIVIIFLIVAISGIVYAMVRSGEGSPVTLVAGAKAPLFALMSTNGTSFNLNSYIGKSNVLLFFNEGLSCSPCLQQMVGIDKNYSTFSGLGVVVVSITTNTMADMNTWAHNNAITRMMVLPDQTLQVDQEYQTLYAGSMHAGAAPGHTFILVGKDGTILWRMDYGYSTMYVPMNELMANVKSALR